jgi:hypothetical protein
MKSEGRPLITPAGDDPAGRRVEPRGPLRSNLDDDALASARKPFIPREAALAGSPDLVPGSSVAEPMDMPRPSLKLPILIGATAMLLWAAACVALVAGVLPWRIDVESAATLLVFVLPLLLLAVLAMQLVVIRRTMSGSARATRLAGEALVSAQQQLEDGQERLRHSTEATAALAEHAARAMSLAADSMGGHQTRIAEELDRTLVQVDSLAEKLDILTRNAPRIEDRLAKLTQVLARSADELMDRGAALEQQFRTTATASEDARRKLIEANRSLSTQLATLQEGTRGAGEELAGMSELASARLDLTLDRMQTVLDTADQRIEMQTQALVRMTDEFDVRTNQLGAETLTRVRNETQEIGNQIDAVTSRLAGSQDELRGWLTAMGDDVVRLSTSLDLLQSGAAGHGERVRDAMAQMQGDTERMTAALAASGDHADSLIRRAETLLLALDSGLRELDESLPPAFTRAEKRVTALREAIRSAQPALESMEAVALGVASRIEETDERARAQTRQLEASFGATRATFENQEQAISRLVSIMATAREEMQRLGDAPDTALLRSLEAVSEAAEAAAQKARSVMSDVLPDAVAQLSQASEEAISRSVAGVLVSQLDQLSLVSDNAVKAAHRATDKLNRQMLSLSDSSAQLEKRAKQAAERLEEQDRDYLSSRSAALIGALNSHAVDVSKWLDRDISQAEWNAYLKGDQSLFARRAARMVSHGDARQIQAMFERDSDFAEHVSRYLHDFEALLRTMLGAKDGSALAVTMLASDIGKLYVGLAQATERLRN